MNKQKIISLIYKAHLTFIRVAIGLDKINAFDASEVLVRMFPQLSIEDHVNNILLEGK